ncbi:MULTISPECIES: T3SS effector HopA1 family protein [unclassified Crossiella]|uniref:T3SS effector HopA1 family protein n=1 Tax=unclassified Crossiella TaxID=2620835 RepID=UPI001FFEDA40|nr:MULTISPECIES: T3SS effector HopA1 family protein [unclassified Crossiella]MCK2241647.1 T3SS effector HopA1 family protein [Crossiella sp. S99.2]MCK2255481.1 T3SS effector HopA1 family protein [Crossiella sp. S99.1]
MSLTGYLDRISVDLDDLSAEVCGLAVRGRTVRELRAKLAAALYNEIHTGQTTLSSTESLPDRSLRDHDFERALAEVVPHDTAPVPAEVLRVTPAGDVVVRLLGVRAGVPAESVPSGVELNPGDWIELGMPSRRPAVSAGFFLVEGSRGGFASAAGLRRMFFHVTEPDAAPGMWGVVLKTLEARGLRYRAKALSVRAAYPRRDAVVVYLPGEEPLVEQEIAAELAGSPGLGASTSGFAERLAPGIARAWEPADPRPEYASMSFGQHRSAALAEALISHARTPETPLDLVLRNSFRAACVNPADPARNLEETA